MLRDSRIHVLLVLIYRRDDVGPVLARGAVLDGEAAGDEVVLDVHHHDGGLGLDDLGDPAVPAVNKLLHAHGAVPGRVEDHEQVADLLTVKMIRLS